jgi:DNA-binding CsgD family transcriptional regulator
MSIPTTSWNDEDPVTTEIALREREKELKCLYGVSAILDRCQTEIEPALEQAVGLLPPGWLYPDVCVARIQFDGREYTTDGFVVTQWGQSADIEVFGRTMGNIEVYYTEQRPERHEGVFLKEERDLLNSLAGHIAKTAERVRILQRLKQEETPSSSRRVPPPGGGGQALTRGLSDKQKRKIEDLRDGLAGASAGGRLRKEYARLTNTEIRMARHVARGLSSKEIARIENIAVGTVSRHRENIRRKLGLTNQKVNMAAYLRNMLEG